MTKLSFYLSGSHQLSGGKSLTGQLALPQSVRLFDAMATYRRINLERIFTLLELPKHPEATPTRHGKLLSQLANTANQSSYMDLVGFDESYLVGDWKKRNPPLKSN
jgi:hypothetical protein